MNIIYIILITFIIGTVIGYVYSTIVYSTNLLVKEQIISNYIECCSNYKEAIANYKKALNME